MLLFLQKDLRIALRSSISTLHFIINQVEECTDELETLMTEHTAVYNEMADAYGHHTEEIHLLQAKVAHLEDRSRRNNIM